MGQRCCVVSKDEISPTNATIPLPSQSIAVVARTNSVLNRWRNIEVAALQYIFLRYGSPPVQGPRTLDENTFLEIFPKLKELNLDFHTREAIFRVFDITGRGTIDFRDFCRGLSICLQGTRGEILHFLFDIGVGSHTTITTLGVPLKTGKMLSQKSGHKINADPNLQKSDSAFSNIEDCNGNPQNSPAGKTHSANHLLPPDASMSLDKRVVRAKGDDGSSFQEGSEFVQSPGEGEDLDTVEPSITNNSLNRVLKLCGLTAPPPKLTYRTSNGVPVEYLGNKLTLREYLDFADVYIDDTALQKFMNLFKILPGKFEERNDVMNALKADPDVWKIGDLVYLISERWWQQWCHFAQVYPVYDATNYCVVSLKLSQSGVPSSVEDIPERPDGIDNSVILDPIDNYSIREDLKCIYNTHLQLCVGQVGSSTDQDELEQQLPPLVEVESINNDTSVINGLEELVMKDDRVKKIPLNRIESERSTLTGGEPAIEEPSMDGIDLLYRPFSILPCAVWECLRSYYGGGPAIPRLISTLASRSILDRDEIRANRDTDHAIPSNSDESFANRRGAWVEINPLSLHLFISDCSGTPIPVPGETIAFRSEGMTLFISRIISNYLRAQGNLSFACDGDNSDETSAFMFLKDSYKDSSASFQLSTRFEHIFRVWTLLYHTALDINLDEQTPTSSRNRLVFTEEPRGANMNAPSQVNKSMIRHGPSSWWVLETKPSDEQANYDQHLSNYCNGTKIMLEFRSEDGSWPTERLFEDHDFRLFEIGDKVDGRDQAGNWYPAEIIDIEWGAKETIGSIMTSRFRASLQSSDYQMTIPQKHLAHHKLHKGYIQTVTVHFENYSSKWDEVFPPESNNIAPFGSHTQPLESLSQYPLAIDSCVQWICRYGAVGKFDGSSSPVNLENWSSTNESLKSPMNSPNPGEADKAHLIAVQKSTSNWFGWLSKKENSPPPAGGGAAAGSQQPQPQPPPSALPSLSSTTTSIVRTHFSSAGTKKSKRVSKGTIAVTPSIGMESSNESPQTPRKNTSERNPTNKLTTPAKNMARALFASMGLTPEKAQYGNLNSLTTSARSADVEMKPTESNIHDARVVRRGQKSSHFGTVPGACGLLNIGNTCFMSVGLQCLSHTPLFRSYFLSGRYLDEINRENPLGTGGKLVSEFAHLLKLIWSGSNAHISPFKFKKVLEKCKPIFAGHDQQDAQEFLSEMLDSLHEDVNRVIVKPYVRAPEDHIWDKLTLTQQAEDAWQRHLQRNRSVLVDLFQGQLMSEVTCQSCKKISRTFDPFMLLSVPLPKHSEKQISIYLIRKMPHFPRQPISPENEYDPGAFISCLRERSAIQRYCLNVPKLGDLTDLKVALAKQCGLRPESLVIVEAVDGRMTKICDDREGIATLRDFNYSWSILANHQHSEYPTPGLFTLLALESVKDLYFISNLQGAVLNERSGLPPRTQLRKGEIDSEKTPVVLDSSKSMVQKLHLDSIEPVEYAVGGDPREGDVVCDLELPKSTGKCYQTSIQNILVGTRLDAIDHKGMWYPGQVLAVDKTDKDYKISSHLSSRVHFDNFAPKWDEIYTESDFRDGRLVPLYSNSARKLKVLDLVVINRTYPSHGEDWRDSEGKQADMEIFGFPFMFQVESFRSCEHVYRHLVEQSLRYLTDEELKSLEAKGLFNNEPHEGESWIRTELLPFKIRIVSFQDSLAPPHNDSTITMSIIPWEGMLFPRDKDRPIANVYWNRLQIAVDWEVLPESAYNSTHPRGGIIVDHESHKVACEGKQKKGTIIDDGSVSLGECLSSFTAEEELEDGTWFCNRCKSHQKGKVIQKLYRLPDILVVHIKRFNMTARFREKIRAKVAYPIKSLDMSPYCVPKSNERRKGRNSRPERDKEEAISSNGNIYDLYGVSNHIGGMNGGHYTAFVRLDSGTDIDFDEIHNFQPETAENNDLLSNPHQLHQFLPTHGSNAPLKDRWLFFDDDFVEEIPLDRVVSDQAYVLFYKRRKLTPSNIINMTI